MRIIGIHLESNCVRYHCASVAQTVIRPYFVKSLSTALTQGWAKKDFFAGDKIMH